MHGFKWLCVACHPHRVKHTVRTVMWCWRPKMVKSKVFRMRKFKTIFFSLLGVLFSEWMQMEWLQMNGRCVCYKATWNTNRKTQTHTRNSQIDIDSHLYTLQLNPSSGAEVSSQHIHFKRTRYLISYWWSWFTATGHFLLPMEKKWLETAKTPVTLSILKQVFHHHGQRVTKEACASKGIPSSRTEICSCTYWQTKWFLKKCFVDRQDRLLHKTSQEQIYTPSACFGVVSELKRWGELKPTLLHVALCCNE